MNSSSQQLSTEKVKPAPHCLIALISSMLCLQIGAGGLVTSSLFIAVFILNSVVAIELYANKSKSTSARPFTYITLISTSLCLGYFFLGPTNFLMGTEQRSLIETTKSILQLGNQLGLYPPVAENFSLSLNFWHSLQFLLVFLLVPATVYLTARLSRQQKIYLAYTLIFFAALNICAELYDSFIINTHGKIWGFIDINAKRSSGVFINPNHYGVYIAIFIPLLLSFLIRSINKKEWTHFTIYFSLLALFIGGLLLSSSRGAYLVTIVGFLCTLILSFKNDKQLFSPLKTFLIFVTILLFTSLTPLSLSNELSNTGTTWGVRKTLYAAAPKILADFPLGLGPGGYRFNSPTYITNNQHSNTIFHHSENSYLQLLLECGPAFCLCLIILHMLWLKRVIHNIEHKLISKRMSIWALSALAMVFVHGGYDYAVHIPVYSFSVAILYGLLLSRNTKKPQSPQLNMLPCLMPLSALLIAGIIYFKYADAIITRSHFRYSNQASIEELSQNLVRTPQSWHNWLFLANSASTQESPHHLEFIEKCLHQAVLNNPNNGELWRQLAMFRLEIGTREDASSAYRQYFLLQPRSVREKIELQARFIMKLNSDEFKAILHRELSPSEISRAHIRSL